MGLGSPALSGSFAHNRTPRWPFRTLESGHPFSTNIADFPFSRGNFVKEQSGTDFGKADGTDGCRHRRPRPLSRYGFLIGSGTIHYCSPDLIPKLMFSASAPVRVIEIVREP